MRFGLHAARFAAGLIACVGAAACSDGSLDVVRGGAARDATWSASLESGAAGTALLITPELPLRGDSAYAVVLTRAITAAAGLPLARSAAFASRLGVAASPAPAGAPVALYDADPEAAGNPYPEERLVAGDGVHIPDRYALRGLPDTAKLAAARAVLRASTAALADSGGFSTSAPVRIALSAAVDLTTVTPQTVLFFERGDGRLDLDGAVAEAERRGIARDDIALAFSFPTQPVEDDLVAVQALLAGIVGARAGTDQVVTLTDPDPSDDLPIGIFGPSDAPFADYLAGAPDVSTVIAGLVAAPELRGSDGVFIPARLAGTETPPNASLDFLLTLPANASPPYPVVVVQHGFGGSNRFVLDLADDLARMGLASIGISAASHGRRGSPLDLLPPATVFVTRDVFRQTIADLMTVLRSIEAGIDLDGNGSADLDRERIGYIGISLGGILGAPLVALESVLEVAVLNVPGGKVSFLGQSSGTRQIYADGLAAGAGLTTGDPDFEIYLQRTLEIGQHALDSADGFNFAPRWRIDPFPGYAPRRVLLQEGVGDVLVANELTEALARAGGLAVNTPARDPNGVAGLWIFDPPGGHGILARADVRAQAFHFLASDGTEIIAPAAQPGS